MVVDNILLVIKFNFIYGLLGLNGVGKFILLKMIIGILNLILGKIMFEGYRWIRKDLLNIGFFIEFFVIYENLIV